MSDHRTQLLGALDFTMTDPDLDNQSKHRWALLDDTQKLVTTMGGLVWGLSPHNWLTIAKHIEYFFSQGDVEGSEDDDC